MKLIIDIPEELYETYKGRPPMLGDEGMDMIAQAIANGIPYEERPQDELMELARWVAKEVLDNYFEESSGAFAEIACRKLVKLGLVEIEKNVYKMKGGEEE